MQALIHELPQENKAPKLAVVEITLKASQVIDRSNYMQALESGKPKKGGRVLIHAASGGVGIALVQLAKVLYGAYVIGTTGPKNLDFVKVSTEHPCFGPSTIQGGRDLSPSK